MSNAPHHPSTETDAPETLLPTRASTGAPLSGADTRGKTQSDADSISTPDGPLPGRIGDYRILRRIGAGGMGAVYLAEDVRLGRKAAIKTMRPELAADTENRNRFEREARAAAAIDHDNIVPIWGIGQAADGSPYIAMPFLQGEMLDSRLTREAVSPVGLIVEVGRDVADGLAAAHGLGLIHRDIKPGNIWLEGDPAAIDSAKKVRRVKVLDFGLARSVSSDETQLTASGVVLGTPAYMAPEQAKGEALDGRADLWSLGATLYRMATGRQPFQGPTTMAVLCALIADTPPPVRTVNPTIPPALAALIDQLIQKDPSTRPQTAAEVATRLRQIAGTLDLATANRVPTFTAPAGTGAWTNAHDGTEPDDRTPLRVAEPLVPEPLAEEIDTKRNARPASKTQAVRRAPVSPPLPPRRMPLPTALAVLVIVAAIGIAVFRHELFGTRAKTDTKKEPTPEVKFSQPGAP